MRSRRMLIYTVSILTILSIAAGVFGIYSYRRPLPQTQGALRAPGLREDVTIYRDEWGVPHIFASTTHDLLLAQGYIHAQDRWWQMEMNRHLGTGNLSSITGNNEDAQNADRFIRTTGWNQMAVQSWQNAAPELRSALNAYVQGVNGYIADLDQGELAVQYTLLGLTGRGFEVMPWEPVHSLAWAVAFNWSQSGNLIDEIESAQQLAALTPSLRTYFPLLEGEIFDYTGVNTALIADDLAFLDMQTPPRSSSWVVSGALTENGAPLLAADMQAGIHIPPQWYEIGLHCIELTANCPYDVVGFSLVGIPGVVIGHNARIAWTISGAGVDTQDLYMLHLNPDNPRQYEYNGEWHTIQSTTEIIPVNDAEPVVWQVQQTQFGPIVSNPQQRGQPLALRQMEIHADEFITAILQIDKATNWSSFQQALKYRGGAVQNYLYADIDGNIGLQMAGTIPVRTENHTGLVPVPGWNDEYLWESLHSFDEMPSVYNPASGWIIAANQPVDDTQMISTAPAWDAAFRFNRIETLLLESQNHNVDTFAAMQADVYDPFAALVMPMLLDLKFRFLPRSEDEAEEIATLRDYQTWMAAWDYENDMDSPQAALFAMIWVRLVDIIFDDQLHIDSGGGLAERQAVFTLDNSRWWDDIRTPEIIETRDMTLYRAFLEAIEDAEQQFDRLRDEWRWGDLHTTRFRSLLPGETGIAAIDELLNRGAVATGGGYSTLNTSGWSTERAHRYEVETAPVLRMIIDLNDFENSRSILATGQSGHPASPHYDDMIDLWRSVAYRDMLWERSTIQESSESTLRLRPALPDQLNP